MLPVLIVGGAPRIPVDAVRHLSAAASGRTAWELARRLHGAGHPGVDVLLAQEAIAKPIGQAVSAGREVRYDTRPDLERELHAWIIAHRQGLVAMSAAINDYELDEVSTVRAGIIAVHHAHEKIASGADQLVIRLRPASKLIDQLRGWGLQGPIVGFKVEDAPTVLAAAQALRLRVGAALVLANSLDGTVQALLDDSGVRCFPDRHQVLAALADAMLSRVRLTGCDGDGS